MPLGAQHAWIEYQPKHELPPVIDGNSAAVWWQGELVLFHSDSRPTISRGPDQFNLSPAIPVNFVTDEPKTVWIEAAWADPEGSILVWYHTEPRACDGRLAAPQIGAGISLDGGYTVYDLGIVLRAGDEPNCQSQNGFFASGHGDFSVVLDPTSGYFYFYFTNYAGPASGQGVVAARLAYEDRFGPVGRVAKFHEGAWESPGLEGPVSAIFPATKTWDRADTDSFWGPSVHFNEHLGVWVMLLNRACCAPEWPQAGIYLSFAPQLDSPAAWQAPRLLLARGQLIHLPGFYPQILGLGPNGTDTLGDEVSRLYVQGMSIWNLRFSWDPPPPQEEEDDLDDLPHMNLKP
ncbi:MAG: hypothetical protein OHK0021_11280 [Bryobacter sp.]